MKLFAIRLLIACIFLPVVVLSCFVNAVIGAAIGGAEAVAKEIRGARVAWNWRDPEA